MATKTIRIILAEDCKLYTIGFRQIIEQQAKNEIDLICTATNSVELLDSIKKYKPHVVVTIANLGGLNSIQLCKMIKTKFPMVKLLLLIDLNDEQLILEILEAGATGFIQKKAEIMELINAIKTVADGDTYFCSSMPHKFWENYSNHQLRKNKIKSIVLSKKELQIIEFISKGYTTKVIAKALKLSPRTIEDYRHKILEKVGVYNVAELVFYAVSNSLIHSENQRQKIN